MKTHRPRRSRTGVFALLLAALALVAGCSTSTAASTGAQTRELRYQGWANEVILPELAEDLGYLGSVKLKWVGNTISGPQDIQAVATGQVDFGGAFDGAIAKLVTAGAPIKAVISYYGSDTSSYNGFYVLDTSPIRTARDLIGKKVGVNTLGGHNEAVLYTYLRRQGLSNDEIKQVQLVALPPVNTEQALRQRQIDVAALTDVFQDQAVARGGVRLLFSDSQLFGSFTAGSYVFRTRFLEENPDTVRQFVAGVAKAIVWTQTTPRDQVIARFTKIIQKRHRNESAATLRYWKSTGIVSKGGLISDADFSRWENWLVQTGSITPGRLKPSDIYTNQFNPYASGAG